MEREITDARSFWSALGMRATGVSIITTSGGDGPAGFLALSASHLAASPPTMTISVSLTTSAYTGILTSGAFAINYLSKGAAGIYERFTAKDAPKGAERFSGLDYYIGKSGSPVFEAVTGALECKVVDVIERYATAIVIGNILWSHENEDMLPMLHFRGGIFK